jgi:1-deoxy-D-xylulose-5-phosphate synthase
VFGEGLAVLMSERDDVVCITAAMPSGTGTGVVAKAHPKRFFDVGIAEGHAVTFAAGLATRGIRPVVAIYSTFLQRAFDNIIHDVALQHLPVLFCMDRAGLVGEDGETHMGLYDIAYMLAVPGMTVTAPKDGGEMLALLRTALAHEDGPMSIRYPRAPLPAPAPAMADVTSIPYGTWDVVRRAAAGAEVAILAVGTHGHPPHSRRTDVGSRRPRRHCRQLPFPQAVRRTDARGRDVRTPASCWWWKKEPSSTGSEPTWHRSFSARSRTCASRRTAVPDRIIYAASRARQLASCGLDAAGIAARVRALHESEALTG